MDDRYERLVSTPASYPARDGSPSPMIEAWALTRPLRFTLMRQGTPSTPELDRAWEEACGQNPRLFDGDFLSVERFDAPVLEGGSGAGHVVCRVERYRRLAVGPGLGVRVSLLALTGVVTTRDSAGCLHALVGLRGKQTRMYGGLWEFAPAGGVDAPGEEEALDASLLERVMRQELEEEVGLDGALLRGMTPRLVVLNREASSYDIAMFAEIEGGIEGLGVCEGRDNWEYERVAWVPVERLISDKGGAVGVCGGRGGGETYAGVRGRMVPQAMPMIEELARVVRLGA